MLFSGSVTISLCLLRYESYYGLVTSHPYICGLVSETLVDVVDRIPLLEYFLTD